MIKVISFDIGGTLLRENNDNQKNYNIDALTNLLGIPKEIVRSAYKEVFQKSEIIKNIGFFIFLFIIILFIITIIIFYSTYHNFH